jgi:hypothetical protein
MLFIFGEIAKHYIRVPLRNWNQKPKDQKVTRAKKFLIENCRLPTTLEQLA